jgi:hypothetical protein
MTSIRYQVGGALLQDVSSYVTRDSDRQLLEALKAGEFCYVLNSRQMGKSSLMVRTLAQLQESGWKGIILDFSAKDTQSDQPSFWYNGIINQLNNHFKLLDRGDFRTWLKERDFISPVERLGEFIETVLLLGIIEPIIIFVDEIDSTLGLPFTDDFFALIRACYNRRAEKPDYKRLTFALLGVAAPSELIGDTKRTPFNIGKSIDLSGFTLAEAQPLAAGLAEKSENPQAVLEAILYWTGGQPFLSQRLCQLVADANDHITAGSEASFVEGLVRSRLIENWESQDQQSHLKTIRDRVIKNEQKAGYLLELYRQTRQAGSLPVQNRPEEQELQLSGLVVKREGNLQVYNPIYGEVFNESWIDGELAKLRPYSDSFRAWIVSGRTDKSRLLRGGALKEAEQWAKKKNPSAEDQDFLSASRTQEREEEIAVKEREGELERERQDKEAAEERAKKAEEAKQILAAANDEARKRLQQAITEGEEKRQQAITEGDEKRQQAITEGQKQLTQAIHEGEEKRQQAITEGDEKRQQAITEGQKQLTQAIHEGEEKRQQAITEGDEKRQQAIDEGQKKRKQITIVGGVILAAALSVAGFFSWEAAKQQSKTYEQIKIAQEATEKANQKGKEVEDLSNQLKYKKHQLDSQKTELTRVTNESANKQRQADRAKKDAEAADKKAKDAEKIAQKAQGDLTKTQAEKEKISEEATRLQKEAIRLGGVAKQAEENATRATIAENNAIQATSKARQAESEVKASLDKTNKALKLLKDIPKLAAELRKKGNIEASNELSTRATSSVLTEDYELKRIWLLAAKAQANQSLDNSNKQGSNTQELNDFKQSLESLKNISSKNDPGIFNQVKAFAYLIAGQLNNNQKEDYQMAYNALQASKLNLYDDKTDADMLTEKDVDNIYYQLIKAAKINVTTDPVTDEVAIHFRNHLYDGLGFLLKNDRLMDADKRTSEIMLYIAGGKEEDGYFTVKYIQNFSCSALREIDAHWYKDPHNLQHKFGFRKQKEIWQRNGSPNINSPDEMWLKFYNDVGWIKGFKELPGNNFGVVDYENLSGFRMDEGDAKEGNLPMWLWYSGPGVPFIGGIDAVAGHERISFLVLRTVTCSL